MSGIKVALSAFDYILLIHKFACQNQYLKLVNLEIFIEKVLLNINIFLSNSKFNTLIMSAAVFEVQSYSDFVENFTYFVLNITTTVFTHSNKLINSSTFGFRLTLILRANNARMFLFSINLENKIWYTINFTCIKCNIIFF